MTLRIGGRCTCISVMQVTGMTDFGGDASCEMEIRSQKVCGLYFKFDKKNKFQSF